MISPIIKHLNRIPMERHMSDWQIGDLAVCVKAPDDPRFGPASYREGAVYTVTAVVVNQRGSIGLQLADVEIHSGTGAAWHGNFRKIRPDEHEACEPEFITLLKRAKRPVMTPLAAVLRDISKPSPAVAAVLIAGPIAKQLNAEAARDKGPDNG